jgi:hypothetical protein
MNKEEQINQRIKRVLRNFSRAKRLFIYFELRARIIFYELKQKFLRTRRARAHWVGRYERPRRPERLLFVFIFFGAMLLFEPQDYLHWSVWWGGMAAVFVSFYSLYLLAPRKRRHWVGR